MQLPLKARALEYNPSKLKLLTPSKMPNFSGVIRLYAQG